VQAAVKSDRFSLSYGGEIFVVSIVDVPCRVLCRGASGGGRFGTKGAGICERGEKQAVASGVKAETFVREGEAYQAIISIAKANEVNTIVLGSHGRTGLKRLLMGSVAEKVIGYAPCPVLVTR
jgi:nucleotide-binding universal stress UspA family protein